MTDPIAHLRELATPFPLLHKLLPIEGVTSFRGRWRGLDFIASEVLGGGITVSLSSSGKPPSRHEAKMFLAEIPVNPLKTVRTGKMQFWLLENWRIQ